MTGDSDVILPYRFEPDGLWSSSEESEENDSDNGEASPVLPNDWVTFCGDLVRTAWLCHAHLSALAARNFQKSRSV